MQDENIDSMQNEGAYRAVLYTCVAAHWVTLLTAMHLVGTTSINPLALLGELVSSDNFHISDQGRLAGGICSEGSLISFLPSHVIIGTSFGLFSMRDESNRSVMQVWR